MEYDILTLKRKLLVKYPFFGRVITNVNFIEKPNIETAATDGKNIYYNPNFLKSLNSVSEQLFLLAHEVCHIAFNHIKRSEGKDKEIWNIATDAVINQFLIRDGLDMIHGGVDIKEAISYDAERMYEKLLREREQNQNKEKENDSKNRESSDGHESSVEKQVGHDTHDMWGKEIEEQVGHDTHDMWGKEIEEQKAEKREKRSILDRIFNRENKTPEKSELEKAIEEIREFGETKAFDENKKEKKKKLEEMKKANVEKSVNPGMTSDGNLIKIDYIGRAKNIIDWRYILREAINSNVDWSYNNAEIEDGVMIPNLEEQQFPETEILLDTSGSISEDLLKNFLRETKNILGVSKINVGCFDVNFYGFQEIRTLDDIENMTFQGGGGTNFEVAVKAFSKRVENKIIFTDGEAYMPRTSLDAVWIVFGNTKINPPGGRVIYISQEQLNELCSYDLDVHTSMKR